MKRYIDADAIGLKMPFLNSESELLVSINDVKRAIEQTPTADVEEVKHGYWEAENSRPKSSKFICSVCGELAYYIQPNRDKTWAKRCPLEYCPNCGAKMDGERKDVVEVVRCGQCKFWSKHEGCIPFQNLRKCFRQYGAATGKDDFCSLGEKGEQLYD